MEYKVSLIILAAGNSSRFEKKAKKQWLWSEEKPLWLTVADKLGSYFNFIDTIVVAHKDDVEYMRQFCDYKIIEGGAQRQYSLKNGVNKADGDYVLITDVARACISKKLVLNLIKKIKKSDCVVPYLPVNDTVIFDKSVIDRSALKRVQTPQISKKSTLKKALRYKKLYTDESTLIQAHGGLISYILGEESAEKITYSNDLLKLPCLKPPKTTQFIGYGFDVHPFEDNKPMYLGGVKIDYEKGFKAHSDGDVALHALIDAIMGAASLGDIGEFFPDSNNVYLDIDSKELLKIVVAKVWQFGYEVINVDITIMAQTPKLLNYKHKMKKVIAKILGITPLRVNIKATTTERLGFIGRKEGIAVSAIANLKFYDWTKEDNE